MKPPDRALLLLVRQWLSKAELDYRTAERLCDSDPIRESVAFHCQQAAEKYLKALLVFHRTEFPKTHNIGQLLDILSSVSPEMADLLADVDLLTPFGVEMRYPGDFPEILPGQERLFVELARRTRDSVMAELSGGLQDPEPRYSPPFS